LQITKISCLLQTNPNLLDPTEARAFIIQAFNSEHPRESEDCLYLNVYAPSTLPPPGGYPVMFWIYGGSLEFGDAGQTYYDGSSFAAFEDVIVVTTNYCTNGMYPR
jgi:acetylcholinesterase